MIGLKNQTALVTGASRGLGKGITLALAEQGADIIINYHSNKVAADDTRRQVEEPCRKAVIIKADVGNKDDENHMFQEINKKFGKLDILVNNAGTTNPQNIFESDIEDWEFIIKTNLTSVFLCSKEAGTAAPFGITVNCVAPGIIETELLFQTHGKDGVKKLADSVLLGLGSVRDVGFAVAYLAGEGGRYITGSTIDVNGGMYLR